MGNENKWAGSRLQSCVAPSRPVANAWHSQWIFHDDDTINAPSLPTSPEAEVAALFSSLAMKSLPDQDDDASASFSEAQLFASDSYQVDTPDAKRGRSGAYLPCSIDIIVTDESGVVCDPVVGQETGITSSGGNSSSGGQSTGWGTPDRNPSCSPFGSSRTDQCFESYSGSEQWATTRSAVINYWPADYDHEFTVGRIGSTTAQVSWHAGVECDSDGNQRASRDAGVDRRGAQTRLLKTSAHTPRGDRRDKSAEHCETCYERQMELKTLDNDINAASSSKFKLLNSESRNRWFPKSQSVEGNGGIAAGGT